MNFHKELAKAHEADESLRSIIEGCNSIEEFKMRVSIAGMTPRKAMSIMLNENAGDAYTALIADTDKKMSNCMELFASSNDKHKQKKLLQEAKELAALQAYVIRHEQDIDYMAEEADEQAKGIIEMLVLAYHDSKPRIRIIAKAIPEVIKAFYDELAK